ncbi:hypothetical protein HMPREF9318_02079 [Streptococcus urinalis FB127-CNA-2]|uniref:Oxidoreductase, NAD-binding domain protein n=1 Tax=Streptococcus urinalis 2285-97 TaxID=764291 RepID=G5KCF8_9STRE|nr:Gfo/Idh/MocA family oxidoreductase [Streptococcus urinalis]EHJ55848.1 oxidoreductase, NAD-binding domain protein [Streptococcus urinalis 2285-97]EKS17202.1 hypothetical protein HMPREF9318_02079 [Streptococcus urinalis FB127-CNA-2]VEF32548.1 NAD-dependent oxidoreductase [Streptococcus urinalis]
MKLAIIGTGKIVHEVLPVLKKIEGIELAAIVSTKRSIEQANELAQSFQIDFATDSLDKVLDSPEVDTVYVAVPNHLHFETAKRALLAGKHVICEKPFTLEAYELDQLISIATENQLILLEAITNQYLGNFKYIKENLGKLGEIKIVECNYSQYSSRYDAFKKGEIAPAFDATKGGGALRDLNIYNIHLMVGLFGKPKTVHYLANIEKQVDTSGILVLDYDQFKAVCIGAKDCSAEVKSTIQGNKGSLAILGPTNEIPELREILNSGNETIVQENQPQHRMYEEFLVFEEIISHHDFDKASKALEHSKIVMDVLDQAVKSMSKRS